MSDEERSAEREHRSVLAGMTRKEAEALVDDVLIQSWEDSNSRHPLNVICEKQEVLEKLKALAALGARCVGAKEMWMARHTGLVYSDAEAAGKARLSVLVLEGE